MPIESARVRLPLGEEIESFGGVSQTSIATAAKAARKLCGLARQRRSEALDVFLTAPGRHTIRPWPYAGKRQLNVLFDREPDALLFKIWIDARAPDVCGRVL